MFCKICNAEIKSTYEEQQTKRNRIYQSNEDRSFIYEQLYPFISCKDVVNIIIDEYYFNFFIVNEMVDIIDNGKQSNYVCVGKILSINFTTETMLIHYLGWSARYNECVSVNEKCLNNEYRICKLLSSSSPSVRLCDGLIRDIYNKNNDHSKITFLFDHLFQRHICEQNDESVFDSYYSKFNFLIQAVVIDNLL